MRLTRRSSGSAEELLQFLYLTPVGIVKFHRNGAVDLMNPAALALLLPMVKTGGVSNFYTAMAGLIPDLATRVTALEAEAGAVINQEWLEASEGSDTVVLSLSINRVNRDCYMAVLADVTRIARQDRALFADREKFRAIFQHVRDYAIYTITLNGSIDEWNPSIERYAGWLASDVLRRKLDMFWRPDDLDPRAIERLLETAGRVGSVESEGWQLKRDGSRLWGNTVITALPDQAGAVRGYVVVSRDITERKRREDDLQRLAVVDPLTGAYNRRHAEARLSAEFAHRARDGSSFAVLMLDIDHFKTVNDRFGHLAGDEVLKTLTRVCKATVRIYDTVARWGGEEFLLVLPGADGPAAEATAERLRSVLAGTRVASPDDGGEIRFTVSIGVATPVSDDSLDLIGRADKALYISKANGRDQVTRAA